MNIHHTMTIRRAPADVYAFWRKLENLARLVPGDGTAEAKTDRISHWRAQVPGGLTIEWDAELTEDTPGKVIAWQSLPGSPVQNAGAVRFNPGPDASTTTFDITIEYTAPGGMFGGLAAKLGHHQVEERIAAALDRVKRELETGGK